MKVEAITLENGIEYGVMKEKGGYLLLANPVDITDLCVRKVVKEKGKEYIESLDNEEELKNALKILTSEN